MARHHRPNHDHDGLTWPPAGDDFPVVDLARAEAAPAPPPPRSERAAPAPSPPLVLPPPREPFPGGFARPMPRGARVAAMVLTLGSLGILAVVTAREGDPAAPPPAPAARAEAPARLATASLSVSTQPPGAQVFLGDRLLGASPVTVPAIEAGEHLVVIRHARGTIRHKARLAAGESVSIVVPIAATPEPVAAAVRGDGSIRVLAPLELRVTRDGRLLGTSEMARIPLTPGTHTLALASEAAGYRTTRTVRVAAGRTTTVEVDIPEQPVAINAIPWAEVIVDGRPVGETPLGTLTLPVGPHVVVLRHPRFGEKTFNTVVRAGEPARISVDMRR